ncbi:RDD family protein [Lysinibacillus endophyticus]|uniref:RDD family protein n=1 Tax=Ureibacillus endophyticus TaxID=1978490 RepID=A0A494ZB54_9BACL|nr:RDD family protein [Lysinibacillus endophyticus]MCP1145573.1 RDD family protein [Lysinibacillus endophyticus]RKQ20037.1 RDD family protein [Lysinibacillus endophyticus]
MSEFGNNESNLSNTNNEIVPAPNKYSVEEIEQYEEKTAGFWVRFWAFAIDSLLVSAIVGILVNPVFRLFGWSLNDSNWYAPITIISAIIYYAYFVLTTKIWNQTIGKMIFGLKVKRVNGEKLDWMTVLFREIVGRFINNTIKILYIIVAFMPKNKGLNDVIADTIVVHEKVYTKNKVIVQKKVDYETDQSISAT